MYITTKEKQPTRHQETSFRAGRERLHGRSRTASRPCRVDPAPPCPRAVPRRGVGTAYTGRRQPPSHALQGRTRTDPQKRRRRGRSCGLCAVGDCGPPPKRARRGTDDQMSDNSETRPLLLPGIRVRIAWVDSTPLRTTPLRTTEEAVRAPPSSSSFAGAEAEARCVRSHRHRGMTGLRARS
jgi:hypothetical protein